MNLLLQAQRHLAEALQREQTILSLLVNQNRNATREEERTLSEIRLEAAKLEKYIAELTSRSGTATTTEDTNGPAFRDVVTGEEYRAVRHGQPLTATSRGNSSEQLSPGKLLRGALVGRWEGADAELRAFGGLSGPSGAFLLPTAMSDLFVDAARNQTRVIQAGALSIELPARDCVIATVARDAVAKYKPENEAISADQMQFSTIVMSARTLACFATLSMEILQDAANLDSIVTNAFAEAIAREMDRVALFGSNVGGTSLGLYYSDSLNQVIPNANGFTLSDYDEFSEAIQKVEDANGEATSAIYSPRTAAKLRELKETANNQYLNAPEFFTKLNRFTTNQVPNDLVVGTEEAASAAFVGDFSQLLFGIRQGLRLDVSEHADEAFDKYQFKIRATMRYDVAILRNQHFSVIKGIK